MKKIKRGSVVKVSFNNVSFCGIALTKHKTKGWYVISDTSATYWPESEIQSLFNIEGRKTTFEYGCILNYIKEWPNKK